MKTKIFSKKSNVKNYFYEKIEQKNKKIKKFFKENTFMVFFLLTMSIILVRKQILGGSQLWKNLLLTEELIQDI